MACALWIALSAAIVDVSVALARARAIEGTAIDATMPTPVTTSITSISVKPFSFFIGACSLLFRIERHDLSKHRVDYLVVIVRLPRVRPLAARRRADLHERSRQFRVVRLERVDSIDGIFEIRLRLLTRNLRRRRRRELLSQRDAEHVDR